MEIISGQHLSNLVQIGFMAGFHGEHQKAEEIFAGLQKVKPDNIDISMGLAVSKMSIGRILDAIQIIEQQVLHKEPDHRTAQCFLAWAYRLQGDQLRYSAISEEINKSQDADAIALLKSLRHPDKSTGEVSQ